jgi:hypothetical protein
MIPLKRSTLWVAAAVATAVLLQAGWILLASHSVLPAYEIDGYLNRATRLMGTGGWIAALSQSGSDVLRPPLYPIFLMLGLRAGMRPSELLYLQVGLAAWEVVAMYWLALNVAGRRSAIIAAFVAACWPPWILASATFAGEHLDLPLVTTALALTVSAYRRTDGPRAAAAGAIFGVAALTRSTSLYLAPLLAAMIAPRLRSRALLLPAALVLVVAPYIAFISRGAGHAVLIENLLEWDWVAVDNRQPDPATLTLDRLPAAGKAWVKLNPEVFVRSAVWRTRHIFLTPDVWEAEIEAQSSPSVRRANAVMTVTLLVVCYLAALFALVRGPDLGVAWLLGGWMLLHTVVIVFSPAVQSRHRVPMEPALIVLAVAGLRKGALEWVHRPHGMPYSM